MDPDLDYFENRTFGEIRIGESASLKRTLSKPDIELSVVLSGNVNPTQLDEEFARLLATHISTQPVRSQLPNHLGVRKQLENHAKRHEAYSCKR